MSGVYINLLDTDLFKTGGNADHLIKIEEVDNIVKEERADGVTAAAVYNAISTQLNETIQFFLTFDDVIKYIHFGKALGSLQVEGTIFCDCTSDLPRLDKLKKAFTELRGKQIEVNIKNIVLNCVMTSMQFIVVPDPNTMANFTFNFAIIDHQL